MILNHKDAIEFLVDDAGRIGFDRHTILSLHALLADNLLADSRAAGRLRHIAVGIDGSVFHPLETPALIEECFDQILATVAAIGDPFEQAFFVMVQLPYLQPFDDVNKRVSRLAEGEAVTPFPRRLGNMTVGRVTEVGGAVRRFKVGDRVYGHLPIRETHTVPEDGPYKSMAAGSREQELHLVPPELSPEQVVLLDPAHFALAAVRDANVRVGERVAVFGLGAIGLPILQMTILSGAATVYAVDPLPARRALARRLGATACYDPAAGDVGLEIKQATAGAGVDVAIEVSGNYGALQDAIRAVHYSGLVHPIVPFEQSAEAYHWIQDDPDRVVKLGIRFP